MPRPSTPKLSQPAIARAALALVDATGEVTMPGLARRLRVSPSSLYHHVRGKAEVIELLRGLVFADQEHAYDPDEPWDAAVRRLAHTYRDACAAHPRLIPLLTSHTVAEPHVLRMYEVLATVLIGAGLTPAQTLDTISTVDALVLGAALDLGAPDPVWDGTAVGADLAAALATAGTGRPRADRAFAFGLELLLSGLRGILADRG